ncbi:MAG: hypothetical protein WD871_08075 [Xanthobacteraceae bacterium]
MATRVPVISIGNARACEFLAVIPGRREAPGPESITGATFAATPMDSGLARLAALGRRPGKTVKDE